MRKLLLLLIFTVSLLRANGHHIIGGVMYYSDGGTQGNMHTYIVHLRLYRGCEAVDNQHAALDPSVSFTIYDAKDNSLYQQPISVSLNQLEVLTNQHVDPCIVDPPAVCYQVGHYDATITLPVNDSGYIVTFQRCCRSDLLDNVNSKNNVGATYFTRLPGRSSGIIGDNSPYFAKEEAVLICANSKFSYDYSATDPDGDELSYSFASAYSGGSSVETAPSVTPPPPYAPLTYVSPYSAEFPLGNKVQIDPVTGIISGTAPATGTYVIAIVVNEYRNHQLIGHTLKDYHIDVTNCHRLVTAAIPDNFLKCESFTINFQDNSTTGKSYLWDFGDGTTSTDYSPAHTYSDTGTYQIKLKVEPDSNCGDSATTIAKVYPVLKPALSSAGNCLSKPTLFTDRSTSTIGNINYWHWDFGNGDTADARNTAYQYTVPNTYNVILTVGNDKGCLNRDTQQLVIYKAPPITLPADTELCIRDSIQLTAQTPDAGSFKWEPVYNILNDNSSTPTFYPRQDTTYYVTFTDPIGCTNSDSVHFAIKSEIKVQAATDTVICTGDPVTLSASADGDYVFRWVDDQHNIVAYQQDTSLIPLHDTRYTILASLQKGCNASSSMAVKTVALPVPRALAAYSICYNDVVTLHASGGSLYSWTPATGLNYADIADPVANPLDTTVYIASVTDTLGCPKPTYDTVVVAVIPPVQAFAGNDTIIIKGQVFQLHATGGSNYAWTPTEGLSDPGIADPLVNNNNDITYLVKVSTPEGCSGTDSIHIRYIVGPEIYVPTAFTPNGDGKNDILRPIPVGITRIDYFRVFNRWGQLVYETRDYLQGWDGRFKGRQAEAGAYVWMVQGTDYTGAMVMRKGTAVLIR